MWPGTAFPLGATYDGVGTNFSLFSEVAEAVELCLIDRDGRERRIRLDEVDGYCWHCYLPNVGPGQFYGFRVYGPYDPARGLRCDPSKLLLDPYGKAFHGDFDGDASLFSYPLPKPPATEPSTAEPSVTNPSVTNPSAPESDSASSAEQDAAVPESDLSLIHI